MDGSSVGKDTDHAIKLIQKASAQGDADAQYALGQCYANGKGIGKDEQQAKLWYGKAASQDHQDAQYELGQRSVVIHALGKLIGKS